MVRYHKLGLIGAMDEEIEQLRAGMHVTRSVTLAGISFMEGTFAGKSVVLCKCGVGKVNAAVCTQLLIDHFHIDACIFTGVAGALDPKLNIGDIVISTACMHHDMNASALGFPPGTIPYQESSVFSADPELIDAAITGGQALLDIQIIQGKVLSGDQFIADRSHVKKLHTQFEGTCTEMEGAAVAQTCFMNQVPYVVIRTISDKADGSAHVDFEKFTALAASHSYKLVEQILK